METLFKLKITSIRNKRKHLYFIKNFYSNSQIKVKMFFWSSNLEERVPHDSVLSCTGFLIAMKEITAKLPPTLHRSIYFDDFAIYGSRSNEHTVKRQLQIALNKLAVWFRKLVCFLKRNKNYAYMQGDRLLENEPPIENAKYRPSTCRTTQILGNENREYLIMASTHHSLKAIM